MADHVLFYLFIFNRKNRVWLPEGSMKDLWWGEGWRNQGTEHKTEDRRIIGRH